MSIKNRCIYPYQWWSNCGSPTCFCGSSSWRAICQTDSKLFPRIWCSFHLSMCLHELVRLVCKVSTRFW